MNKVNLSTIEELEKCLNNSSIMLNALEGYCEHDIARNAKISNILEATKLLQAEHVKIKNIVQKILMSN